MGRSTVHYTDTNTNNILKTLHNKLRPAGTPVQRVEYIIELLLLRIFEVKLKRDDEFKQLRKLFAANTGNEEKLFYYLCSIGSESILPTLNKDFFPFYSNILHEARKVLKGNMSTKVQDQLVLIKDVFANSNFTNNVQSGNLEEVIDLISQIDEQSLIGTDLLGDAIESALSESGGTKEIGLFRTPDHVRQFMVGMLEPKIKDTIFDPACGTGGFLFDSFGFVMESISPEGNWPGPKAHPELQQWFKQYFKKNKADMPSIEESTHFYRAGIYGIEYLGMIRKMAAVNFYVRGLNPHNIEQGDTLAKFNKELQGKEAYSMVLANPPFGAERDQKAYPNVWEEFAKESETTILFVKLMLDALAPGGRCAVVVSEGFLTWEQTSARILRNMLLKEANLQAVIGLPQGVFVSKNGQGPKTSILVFEKGPPTKNVWFYNITNDGFTKGTNRTAINSGQIPEALKLYHQYIRRGKVPPETRNSFSLSVDWLTVVDPRIKDKIRQETTAAFEEKKTSAIEKKKAQLDKKLEKAQAVKPGTKMALFGKDEYQAELEQLELTWTQKLNNEIAKRIDKAHIFSFNSASYRSNLTEQQISEWEKVVERHRSEKNGHSLDKKYSLLKQSSLKNVINHIAQFDPQNAIEADIVREYLSNIENKELKEYTFLLKIDTIFKSGAKYPMVKIKDVCSYEKGKFPTQKTPDGPYPFVVTAEKRKTSDEYQFDGKAVCVPLISSTGHGHASMKRIHYQEGKFALANLLFALFAKDESQLSMKYLYHILSPKLKELFVPLMKGTANVGMKMSDAVEVEFPLPPLDKQLEIVQQIEKQKNVIKGSSTLLKYYFPDVEMDPNWKMVSIGDVCTLQTGGTPDSSNIEYYENGNIRWLVSGDIHLEQIYDCSNRITDLGLKNSNAKILPVDSVLMALNGQGKTRGTVALLRTKTTCNQSLVAINPNEKNKLLPEYLFVILRNMYRQIRNITGDEQRSGLSMSIIGKIKIPLAPIETQTEIKAGYIENFNLRQNLQTIITSATKRINVIVSKLWEE